MNNLNNAYLISASHGLTLYVNRQGFFCLLHFIKLLLNLKCESSIWTRCDFSCFSGVLYRIPVGRRSLVFIYCESKCLLITTMDACNCFVVFCLFVATNGVQGVRFSAKEVYNVMYEGFRCHSNPALAISVVKDGKVCTPFFVMCILFTITSKFF